MDLALSNLQSLMCHETQTTNQLEYDLKNQNRLGVFLALVWPPV